MALLACALAAGAAEPASTNTGGVLLDSEGLKQLMALDPALAGDLRKLQQVEIPAWNLFVDLTTGIGYSDNPTWSYQQRNPSGYSRLGGELTWWRRSPTGWQFSTYLMGEDRRFFSSPLVRKEQTVMGMAQLEKDLGAKWGLRLTGQYFYFDQVMDVSDSQGLQQPLPVLGHTVTVKPAIQHRFGRTNWVELELVANRQWFEQPLDGYWEWGPRLTLGRKFGRKADLSLSGQFTERPYDSRLRTDATGLAQSGALAYHQQLLHLQWRLHLDPLHRWRLTSRLGLERNADNAAGYYDYWRYFLSEQLRYRRQTWELTGNARLSRYDYTVQTATASAGELLERTSVSLGLRGEVNLGKHVKCYIEYEHDRTFSNHPFSQYQIHNVNGGLIWGF